MTYFPYSPDVEVKTPQEDQLIEKIVASMGRVNAKAFDRERHATRDAHAKSHGILKGYLEVYDNLPAHLAQGLFAMPKRYPIVIRLSSAFGHLKDDRIPSAYGMAIPCSSLPVPLPDYWRIANPHLKRSAHRPRIFWVKPFTAWLPFALVIILPKLMPRHCRQKYVP